MEWANEEHLESAFKWLVENHFDNVMALVELIPEYGRYDDWMCLLDSKASEVVFHPD